MIKKSLFSILTLLALTSGLYFYNAAPALKIVKYSTKKDLAFLIDLFEKNSYWLAPNEEYDFEWTIRNHSPYKNQKRYYGQLKINMGYLGNTPIGFVGYYKKRPNFGSILYLGVSKEYRGKKYGYHLLKHAIAHLFNMGCSTVEIITRTNNYRAVTLYKKIGFKTSKIKGSYIYLAISLKTTK